MLAPRLVGLVDASFLCSFRRRGRPRFLEINIEVVVSRNVARGFGSADFFLELSYYRLLNHFSTARVDRVGNVGIQLGTALVVGGHPIGIERGAALVAMVRTKVVFCAALGAVRSQLATGHRHKRSARALDDFEVSNDKTIVKRDRAKGLEPFSWLFHEFDSHFGDFHNSSPCVVNARLN